MADRTWDDLPRNWLMSSLEIGRAHELKAWVLEAVKWGFDQPEGLTNNGRRIRWLRDCREQAWTMLSQGAEVPSPGKAQPVDEKPKRTAAPKRKATPPRTVSFDAPARSVAPEDVFPGRPNPSKRRRDHSVKPDLCALPAREVNAWLATLPERESV